MRLLLAGVFAGLMGLAAKAHADNTGTCPDDAAMLRAEAARMHSEGKHALAFDEIVKTANCPHLQSGTDILLTARIAIAAGRYRTADAILKTLPEDTRVPPAMQQELNDALTAFSTSDAAAFRYASAEHTIFAYAAYARNYPDGEFIKIADDASYQIAAAANTETLYRRYLYHWPTGSKARDAKRQTEFMGFQVALKKGSIPGWRSFLKEYPEGDNRLVALGRLETLMFQKARKDGSVAAMEAFIKEFPTGNYQKQAAGLLETAKVNRRLRTLTGPVVTVQPGTIYQPPAAGAETKFPKPVRISNALQVMIHEVTFDQWQACVDDGGCSGYMPNDMGWGRGDRPVINVSAADIAGYINWLNSSLQKAGGKGAWRLPTENEWTYLLRGRSVNVPVKPPSDTALVTGACADCDLKDDENATRPVGKLDANQLGLYDMASNANEWTIDCAMGTEDCTFGVVRGTPMPNSPPSMAYRFRQSTPYATRHFRNGFRLVRTLSREEAN